VRAGPFSICDRPRRIEDAAEAQIFAVGHVGARDLPIGCAWSVENGQSLYFAIGATLEALTNRYLHRLIERSLRIAIGHRFETTINAGLIGYGPAFNMGRLHAEAIIAQTGMKTVAVCDLDSARTRQSQSELAGRFEVFDRVEDLLARDMVDLVIVILPHHLHVETCIAASKAGKHVMTEKPFFITLDEADRMIAAAADSGTLLTCFHNRRWDADFLQMLSVIHSGEIGEPFHADAATGTYQIPPAWWRADKQISGGVLYDWGAYCIMWTGY